MNTISDIYLFLKRPNTLERVELKSPIQFIKWSFIYLLLMTAAISFVVTVFITPFKYFDIIQFPPRIAVPQGLYYILLVAIIGPIIEELIFRLPLIFNRASILIAIVLPVFLLNKSNLFHASIYSIITIVIGVFLLYSKFFKIFNFLENLWKNHYPIVFYFFVLLFGIIHIANFKNITPIQYLITPLIVAPQIIAGFFFSYVRVRYKKGLILSTLMHIYMNSISCIIALLVSNDRLL